VVFAPRSHGGLDFVHLYLLQGQKGIRNLLRHIRHDTELGRQMRIDLAWVQLEAGTAEAILEQTQTNLDYIQDGWVLGIRRFLTTVQAAITLVNNPTPSTYRKDDGYLMDIFRAQGISNQNRQKLNRCRMYLQVARLSDVTNIAGTHMYAYVTKLERPEDEGIKTYPTTKLLWPRQPRPGHQARRYWAQNIQKALLHDDGRLRETTRQMDSHY
jgi:hypothetical protein